MAPHAQPPVKGIFTVLAKAMPNVEVCGAASPAVDEARR